MRFEVATVRVSRCGQITQCVLVGGAARFGSFGGKRVKPVCLVFLLAHCPETGQKESDHEEEN